jgi:hypothetical protein
MRELSCIVLKSAYPKPFLFSTPWKWRLPGPFIARGRVVTMSPQGPTGGPGVGEPYTVGHQRLGIANDVFNGVGTPGLVACHPTFSHRYGTVLLRH